MEKFFADLEKVQPKNQRQRRWIYIPYDQLSDEIGPLSEGSASDHGIVLIESSWKGRRRPYHKQKLALVLTNMRHFALEQARRGVAVRYIATDQPYDVALRECIEETGPVEVMQPAERELRAVLAPLIEDGVVEEIEHRGWLSSSADFRESQAGKDVWRMDRFYRVVRRKTGLLMVDGKPEGGKFSFDVENREPWSGEPPAPEPPQFRVDAITREVVDLIERDFSDHPGTLRAEAIPASKKDAARVWAWAKEECLPTFGPYEDAMSVHSSGLFHTRISPLLNIHRLLPATVVEEVAALDAPLASREGFVRQVLGWREFVRHVHFETDGFRDIPNQRKTPVARGPGDGGFEVWSGESWPKAGGPDGGARPNFLGATSNIPRAFWGEPSGLACLDHVVGEVWDEAYSHHITRLMILSNLGALLDIEPRQLTDWFWIAYADAYDWVVEPNVLGMGLFSLGELMTTKPYVSGTPYINRMSDYCGGCEFNPKKNCPISSLYWAYLERHRSHFEELPRMRIPLSSLAKRSKSNKERDASVYSWVTWNLSRGRRLDPDSSP